MLPRALDRAPPQVFNSDGDEVVFHTVRFPFAAKVTVRSVEARLGQLGDLRQEAATFWNWLGPPPAKRPAVKGEKAIVWNVTLDCQSARKRDPGSASKRDPHGSGLCR